jgi:hypothetical protein
MRIAAELKTNLFDEYHGLRRAKHALSLSSCHDNIKIRRIGGYSHALAVRDLCTVAVFRCGAEECRSGIGRAHNLTG